MAEYLLRKKTLLSAQPLKLEQFLKMAWTILAALFSTLMAEVLFW